MIARAIANRAQCTFLNISSSSLMSKWVGDGEKLVRCLFAVAIVKQPSVIFIDEIDSLLSMRGEGEMDAVRRVKTEFLVHLDGVATNSGDRVLLIGATNRPDELDEAARRRLEKRLYIPLPDLTARQQLIERLLATLRSKEPNSTAENPPIGGNNEAHCLSTNDFVRVAEMTAGYSGADLRLLCREAAMGPLREMTSHELSEITQKDLRLVNASDFKQALRRIKPSVGPSEVRRYTEWNQQYGSFVLDAVDEKDYSKDNTLS
ncbi:unnamed protein product [Phytomonas sp. Hart1]|nr:unnamed protein product [Phytomonas sp. Hart1]|eukprot:CCW72191.1 unnamed protein product [Phytomonas sp. isolate Hart1]